MALRNQYGTGLKPCSRDNDCLACVLIPRLGYKRFNMLCRDLSTSVLDLYENKVAKGADLETNHDIKLATIYLLIPDNLGTFRSDDVDTGYNSFQVLIV
ncbi:MAG TPA: hypothetical protein VIS03_14110 [Kiloniellaceae bacterium]